MISTESDVELVAIRERERVLTAELEQTKAKLVSAERIAADNADRMLRAGNKLREALGILEGRA